MPVLDEHLFYIPARGFSLTNKIVCLPRTLQVYVAPIPDKNEKHPPMVRFPLDLASFISATAYHNKKIANLKVYFILLLISMLCPTYI